MGECGVSDGAKPDDEEDLSKGDLEVYGPTPVERRMQAVYGKWVHSNHVLHLTRGIRDDIWWEAWWRYLAILPLHRYDAQRGKLDRRFFRAMVTDMAGVIEHHCISERFMVFQAVIL